MKKENMEASAAALYDGGWRSTDAEELQAEYDLTTEETKNLIIELKKIEDEVELK